jgi:hypothetical protein
VNHLGSAHARLGIFSVQHVSKTEVHTGVAFPSQAEQCDVRFTGRNLHRSITAEVDMLLAGLSTRARISLSSMACRISPGMGRCAVSPSFAGFAVDIIDTYTGCEDGDCMCLSVQIAEV